jgi:hypothetical protein
MKFRASGCQENTWDCVQKLRRYNGLWNGPTEKEATTTIVLGHEV